MKKVFWFFGRSGAGKTTLAKHLCDALASQKIPVFFLDGDDLRSGICSDLNFTPDARLENHRRVAEIAKLAASQNFHVVAATMAPLNSHRDLVKKILGKQLVWIYVHAPLEICIQRDPKGLYHRARAGKLTRLLDFPFDEPRANERDNFIDTVSQDIEHASRTVLKMAQTHLI